MNDSNLNLFSRIYNPENIYHAWQKAQYIYENESDFVIHKDELAVFEADLKNNIAKISKEIKDGTYCLTPLVPMPLPKMPKDDDIKQSRQNFYITLSDQIVWISIINIIGPILDDKMPFWSFGNRLYMSMWKEDDDTGKSFIKFGTYRSSSRKLYRNWSSSWPLFRKAVSITVKKMSKHGKISSEELDDVQEYNKNAPEMMKIKYWDNHYWSTIQGTNVYYATIDLSKFYPCIYMRDIFSNDIYAELYPLSLFNNDLAQLKKLITNMCDFKIDRNYLDSGETLFPQKDACLDGDVFTGLPTGLFVAGFLSNIAMFEVDKEISAKLNNNRTIAHFRFVDDHVFLATSIDDLEKWILEYESILYWHLPHVKLNSQKTQPDEFNSFIKNDANAREKEGLKQKAEKKCKLDCNIPSPFTTLTIRKISGLSKSPFELMDEDEKLEFVDEIEHILATEFPDNEIKKETRVSWAASILSRIVPTIDFDIEKLYDINKEIETIYYANKDENKKTINAAQISKTDMENLLAIEENFKKCISDVHKFEDRLNEKVFTLLIKALNDNISKPKIWRKLISFCRSTGYNGFDEIIDMLEHDEYLTLEGKKYLFATITSEISRNILIATKVMKLPYALEKDKNRASDFIDYTRNTFVRIVKIQPYYDMFYTNEMILQYALSIKYADNELNNLPYFNGDFDMSYAIKYLWYCMSSTVEGYLHKAPNIPNILKELKTIDAYLPDDEKMILIKLLSMYKNKTTKLSDKKQNIKNNLCNWIEICNNKSKQNVFDLARSEWTALIIIEKICKLIKNQSASEFSFSQLELSDYINCSPMNFNFEKAITNSHSWDKYKINRKNLKIHLADSLINDERYCCKFYNNYGGQDKEKEQVYSLSVLLLTLLSKDLNFHPIINRGDCFEKKHYLLFDKISECHISSYTRAIISGALSYRNFELKYLSFFDGFFKRDVDNRMDPIKIETVDDFIYHIEKSITVLETYQLSLEGNVPRQIIPISLTNITDFDNPYTPREDD